jgi:3-oxoacyl-[acyl-carrier-protein] synthase III
MWAFGDGAAAAIVGMNTGRPAVADFLGAEFTSRSDYNGHILIPYGGTRAPIAPPEIDPYRRRVSERPRREVKETYARGYGSAYETLCRRLGRRGERLICNQISPVTLGMIAEGLGVAMSEVVITGNDTGHLGAGDLIVGLDYVAKHGEIAAPFILGASTAYAFGAGLIVPPSDA